MSTSSCAQMVRHQLWRPVFSTPSNRKLIRHLSLPLFSTRRKLEQTRQLKEVRVTDKCALQGGNAMSEQQAIVNSCLGDQTILQHTVILPQHHTLVIIIDTTVTIHILLVPVPMNGHIDQNQGVSITVHMTSF